MTAFLLFVLGLTFFALAFVANKTGGPHLLGYALICFTGFAIINEIKNKK